MWCSSRDLIYICKSNLHLWFEGLTYLNKTENTEFKYNLILFFYYVSWLGLHKNGLGFVCILCVISCEHHNFWIIQNFTLKLETCIYHIKVCHFLAHLWAYSMVLRVLRPSSIVRRPSSGVVCAEHNSHNIEDNKPLLYTYICYVCRLCAKKIVVPPIKLNSMQGQK